MKKHTKSIYPRRIQKCSTQLSERFQTQIKDKFQLFQNYSALLLEMSCSARKPEAKTHKKASNSSFSAYSKTKSHTCMDTPLERKYTSSHRRGIYQSVTNSTNVSLTDTVFLFHPFSSKDSGVGGKKTGLNILVWDGSRNHQLCDLGLGTLFMLCGTSSLTSAIEYAVELRTMSIKH